ncbi:Uma2 family endonuclease [Aliterella atlantica]|uniref:Putative restriction endonuclease domain-containing protein n=1 Tax=Aliterella atlantica CENA595 TaxID=1618023 RepID=A0A0D8ZVN1_9CYAN|nr:Uma2 family endonuclease [Aliterella atlantica]KJH72833.1 hypothetical protein UH38_04585 [Aliterella atlantica CENA595]
MLQYDPLQYLPSATELPDSDDTPVDNEFQELIPGLLRSILALLWKDRQDWFFAIDMGIYYSYTPGVRPTPIVPDGFLSIGVPRRRNNKGRLSYVLWEENNIVPLIVFEVVSQTYGGEYDTKIAKYTQLGAPYYIIYNPDYSRRDKHEVLEVYRLVDGVYVRQPGDPVWIPEIELAIGTGQGNYQGWNRQWLYWYDRQGNRYPSLEERTEAALQQAEAAQQQAEAAQQQAEAAQQQANQAEQDLQSLRAKLRAQGIDPDTL